MTVHRTAVVGEGVVLGRGVVVGPHAVLLGPCRIGDGAQIGPGCVIGGPPEITGAAQNLAWAGDLAHHGVDIGPGTIVRELTIVQQGSVAPTVVGAGCWLLGRVYVAHDCAVADGSTLSAGVLLGGHVQVGELATIGMNAAVHQHRIVGPGAMVGMSATVTRDVPPYAKVYGNPARLRGANTLGLDRQRIDRAGAQALDAAYRAGRVPRAPQAGVEPAWEWWSERTGPDGPGGGAQP
jgi:UDP-N-acetylglucosamine acyltransferase